MLSDQNLTMVADIRKQKTDFCSLSADFAQLPDLSTADDGGIALSWPTLG